MGIAVSLHHPQGEFSMQKVTVFVFVIGLFIANPGLSTAIDKAEVKKLYKISNGTWKLVSSIKDGTPTPAEEFKDLRMELKNGTWTTRRGKEVTGVGTYELISVKKGYRVFRTKALKGKNAGQKGQHISKIEGDTLTVCHPTSGKDAPKEFSSKKGSGHVLNVWKRVKK
jgi:uncharacterized protein (TIGR03067 family)